MTANRNSETAARGMPAAAKLLIGATLVAFATTAGYFVYQQRAKAQDATAPAPADEAKRVPVVVTPASVRDFERALVVQGNVEAKEFAMVSPRIPGTIETIYVDEGDRVVAGQTKLFQTDAVSLERNVQIKEQATTVAHCSSREAAANLDKVKVDLNKAELDFNRFKRLYDQNAVTADAFEQQQSRYQQLQAAQKLAQAQVELSIAKEDQSKSELEIARKELADATIRAPISGTISQRFREPGEMGSPGQPVVRIDDTSLVEIAAFLPAQCYNDVVLGQTPMRVEVGNIDLGKQAITYKSPTIHPKLRTFEVKCLLKDPPAGAAPGAMARIAVVLETRKGLGVPSSSLQSRAGGAVVFVVRDGLARQESVATGIESDGWTEILQSQVKENEPVVILGQNMLNQGAAVQVQQEEK